MSDQIKLQDAARDLINPATRFKITIDEEHPQLDYEQLTSLAGTLDVMATILAGSDHPGYEELYEALLAGSRYNGLTDEEQEELFDSIKEAAQAMPVENICQNLIDCAEVLIDQLLLELDEQGHTKERRI